MDEEYLYVDLLGHPVCIFVPQMYLCRKDYTAIIWATRMDTIFQILYLKPPVLNIGEPSCYVNL